MKSTGRRYTWTNGHIWSRIDRALCNDSWVIQHGTLTAQFKENNFSDHSPILIEHHSTGSGHHRPFRFLNILTEHESFSNIVATIWKQNVKGGAMYRIWQKMKLCKEPLKRLLRQEMGSLDNRVAEAREKLDSIQKQITQHMGTDVANTLFTIEKEAVVELQKWSNIQEKVLKQKSKVHWLEVGDNNNRYFFAYMKTRANMNNISILTSLDGRHLLKHDEIEKEILQFYKSLMGSRKDCLPSIDINVMRKGPRLELIKQRELCEIVTQEEIKDALFDIADDKAPGIDGYNACFYRKTWTIVREDIYSAVHEFFHKNILLREVNTTVVTLIPKNFHPETMKDFRPIACCTIIYKIISKIISNR